MLFSGNASGLNVDLISFWFMNEGSGQVRMDSVGSNHLTNNNGVDQTTGLGGNFASKFNSALQQSLSHSGNLTLEMVSGAIHQTFWIKAREGTTQEVFSKDTGTGVGRTLKLNQTNTYTWLVRNMSGGDCFRITNSFNITSGSWNFVDCYWNPLSGNGGVGVNVDNVEVHNCSGIPGPETATFYFGIDPQGVNTYFNDTLQCCGLSKRKLTDQERGMLFTSGIPLTPC